MDCRRGALIKKPDGGYALSGLQISHGLIDPVSAAPPGNTTFTLYRPAERIPAQF